MKKTLIYYASIFLAVSVFETIINQLLLKEIYSSLSSVWRTTEELGQYAPLFLIIYTLFTLSFGYLFKKSYSGSGLREGLILGLSYGILIKSWYGLTNLVVLPIPVSLGFLWFFYGTCELIAIGALASVVLDKTKST